jgi:hypothetical protein
METFEEYQPFMLSGDVLDAVARRKPAAPQTKTRPVTPPPAEKKKTTSASVSASESASASAPSGSSFFRPQEKDSLFWCFYVIKNGLDAYKMPGTTSFSNEKTEKFMMIDRIRLNKDKLKLHKIKNIQEDVEDELANKEQIGLKTFIALCVAEGINILVVDSPKYVEVTSVEGALCHVVIAESKSQYCYEIESSPQTYRDTCFRLVGSGFEKSPLRPVSSYKLQDLIDICAQLGVGMPKKQKAVLYELLVQKLS